ncbi:MAG: hypothetical protein KDG50_01265 [Chromatiales bacterium]|nr:hypothetical protein [Chromatiales bacterium]
MKQPFETPFRARPTRTLYAAAAALLWMIANATHANDEPGSEPQRFYRTPQERREAGIRHEIYDWLTVTALVEFETERRRTSTDNPHGHVREQDNGQSLQIAAEITPAEWLEAEVVYEYDPDLGRHGIDEAVVALLGGPFELSAGKQDTALSEFYSHFIIGPVLEFGETVAPGVALSWKPAAGTELTLFGYRGEARREGGGRHGRDDWGLAFVAEPFDGVTLGLGYQSDLADSDAGFYADEGDRYPRRVDVAAAHLLVEFDAFEISAEFVRALDRLADFDDDRNQPRAWNVELAWFATPQLSLALRAEGSAEIEDEPRRRFGVGLSWLASERVSARVEFMRGRFRRGLAQTDEDADLRTSHELAAQISIAL